MNLSNLFSHETVNKGRQPAFDLCKTLCIVLMILCHVFYAIKYSTTESLNATYIAHNLVRLLGAQFFMFSMGMGLAYSRNDTAKCCARRGLILLLTGYMLNFLREILPWMVTGNYPMFGSIMTNDKFLMLLSCDILQFAGLAFLFFALIKYLKWSNLTIFIVTLCITVIGAFCTNEITVKLTPDNFYYSFVGLLIPIKNFTISDYVCFSFSNWIIYPVVGWLFGKALKRCHNLDTFYLYLLGISLPIFLLAWAAFDAVGKNMWLILMNPVVYHQQNPVILAIYMNIIAIAISVAHLLSIRLTKFRFWDVIQHLSSELPTLYIVSWIAIGWLGAWLKYNHKFLTKDFEDIFFVFVGVIAVSEIYIYFKNKYKNCAKEKIVVKETEKVEEKELVNQ